MNLDKIAKMSYTIYISEVEELALKEENEFSSAQIGTYTHEMDNSFIDASFGETVRKLRANGYNFLGVGKAPWRHHDWDVAIVFEDKDTFEKYWCHTSSYLIAAWRAEKGI